MTVPRATSLQPVKIDTPVEKQASFALSKVITSLKRGTVIGRRPTGSVKGVDGHICNVITTDEDIITWGSSAATLGNWNRDLGDIFYDTVSGSGLNVVGSPQDMFGQSKAAQSAEYLIGVRITRIATNVCQVFNIWSGLPENRFGGEMFIDVDWTVFSTLAQREVLSIQTAGYYQESRPSRDGMALMFHGAFARAAENLLGSRKFVSFALRQNEPDAIADQIPEAELTITTRSPQRVRIQEQSEAILSAVATVRIGQGHGSGFFITENGLLLTNAHVVGDAGNVSVILNNGLEIPGRVLRKTESRDVALVQVALRVPNALPIRTEPSRKLERVYVVGTPIDERLRSTVTTGIVSGIREDGKNSFIQADAPISPGNSGGPLLDEFGNVLGLSVSKIIGPGSEGLGLFVPIKDALEALNVKIAGVSSQS